MSDPIEFPTVRAKRTPIEPSVPGENLREIGTAEGWEGIGINMISAGIYYLLDKFGPERAMELVELSWAISRRKHLEAKAKH